MRIDFHTHTTCSDGQYTPEELVQKAAAAGICALAITDHDAVSGIARGETIAFAYRMNWNARFWNAFRLLYLNKVLFYLQGRNNKMHGKTDLFQLCQMDVLPVG